MSHSRSTLTLVTVLLVFLGLGGAVAWRLLRPSTAQGGAAQAAAQAAGDQADGGGGPEQFSAAVAQPVRGAQVLRDTLWIRVRAAGQAEAFRRTAVTAQVEGRVRAVPVRENERVAAGASLLQIDTTDNALQVAQARANLLAAETDYRQRILFDDEITDARVRAERERIARSTSQLDQRGVDLRQAEIRLERTGVTAPFEGRVADLRVVEGEYVTSGTELMTIVDLDPIKVEVQVLEAELGALSEGRRAQVTFAAFPGQLFEGRVASINPLVDPSSRTGRVTVFLANPDGRVKPGMYAEVALDAEALPDRVLVPREAILQRGDRRPMLFVHEDAGNGGLAKWRYVNPGRANDVYVEILPTGPEPDSVEPGEVVLIDGHHYLAHDTPIRLVENVTAEGGRPGR
jgi:RND family efflux transporter MFP subunit